MPSLRERKARPSYALLAEGLEDLSGDDRDSDASHAEGSEAGAKRRANLSGSDQDMASTSESERKASKMKQKGKGKATTPAKPRGKATKWAVADDDSGSEYEKASEEEEEEDEDELEGEAGLPADIEAELQGTDGEEDEDMSVSDIEPVSLSTPKPSAPRAPFTGAPSHSKQAAYVQTESNLIPQHYRELIKKHAEAIAAPVRGNANAEEKAREYKTRALDPEILPHGPSTPFVTRLKREVRGKERAEIIYDDRFLLVPGKEDDKTARQAHSTQCVKGVTLLSPWQVWQGEGWWPEMATKVGSAPDADANGTSAANLPAPTGHKGKGKASASLTDSTNAAGGPPGWILREQVRLGLESVGRYRTGELKFIQEPAAGPYLPRSAEGKKPIVKFNIGPHSKQRKLDFTTFDSHILSDFNSAKRGFVFSAGGPIWGLDWCPFPDSQAEKYDGAQYLALSTLPSLDSQPAIGDKWASDSKGCIQIWAAVPPSVNEKGAVIDGGSARCELVLCVDGGPIHDLKWMPMGAWDDESTSSLPKLGIIAACQLDGSVSFYAVPHPREMRQQAGTPEGEPLYWQVEKPLLKLDVPDAMCCCLDWINGGRIVCGLSNGFLAFWDVLDALRNPGDEAPLPAMYFSAAQSIIRTIAIGRIPSHDSNNNVDYSRDPVYIAIGSHDATSSIVDLRDPGQPFEIVQTRMPLMAVGWSDQVGNVLMADPEHTVQMYDPVGKVFSKTYNFSHHRGPVWGIATSDYHTMALTCSADGSLLLSNLQTGWFRRRGGGMIYQRLFEIDYDKYKGEYRILDDFQIEEIPLDGAAQKNTNRAKGTAHSMEGNPIVAKSGDWPLEVGVHKTCWNNNAGLGKANWIASGTASGLCRIDIIQGRFIGGKVPQGMGPP